MCDDFDFYIPSSGHMAGKYLVKTIGEKTPECLHGGREGTVCKTTDDCDATNDWTCADWQKSADGGKSKTSDGMKCAAQTWCGGPHTLNGTDFNIQCDGLVGADCKDWTECDTVRNLTCADW